MNMKHGIKYLFGICLLPVCVGCNDELDSPSSSGSGLHFTATESVHREVGTRSSSGGDSLLSSGVTPLEAEGRTLYLHTTVTDGIEGAHLGKDEALTRATPVNDMSTYGSFSVFAAFYQGAWSPASQTMNFMYNVPVSLSGSVWSSQPDYYWPGRDYKVRFYAYAPIDAQFVPSRQDGVANDFYIKYIVSTDVSKQKDLLIAKSAEYAGNHGSIVPLEFKHVFTAVRFVVGDDMKAGTVNKVRLRNITSGGVYHPETGYVGKLVGQGIVKDFEQELNKVTDGTPGAAITAPFQTFMLPPQGFTDDSSVIEIVFTDDEGEHTLSASLKDQMWNSGTTVTYKISTSSINWDYHLDVTGPSEYSYAGGTDVYKVTSYRENSKGVKEAVSWTAEFSTDGGASWTTDKPDWLTDFTTSGQGSTVSQSFNATVGAQAGTDTNPHTAILKAAAPKGSAGQPYNLSNGTGAAQVVNTANCYVVGAPGYYSFPLVYGNAVKNGATNTSAYTTANSGSNILSTFINHTGNGITDPYITNNAGCVPAKAELVWQDALSLVSDIKYNSGTNGGNISFKVDPSTIRQGNAVIAIKDVNDQILWSWHIWVTDEEIKNTIAVTNRQNVTYNLMSVNLGWCDSNTTSYAGRSCKVKFTAGEKSQEITLKQASNSITTGGNSPFYQWGRKDPFLPSDGLADANKTWYDKAGNASTLNPATEDFSTGIPCIKNYILKPNVMQSNASGDALYQNLWSADNNVYTANDNLVVKTIYDPSPVGFKLPASNAFTGFTKRSGTMYNPAQINGTWDDSSKGWRFYTNSVKDKTIFFPASGRYNYSSGVLRAVGSGGWYWLAVPGNQTNGYILGFNRTDVSSNGGFLGRGWVYGVRSSQE
ncbi:fimbrillin family protein [Bacteroides fragilis]|uniref:fimbrillin family protein n=1 Tax=Bacteroides fragilis TaxID=817 RepID=UPI00245859AD|nr:fimbrillin family protein [Bacteroides fragilis]